MYNNYTDVLAIVSDLIEYVKSNFSDQWLLESDCAQPEQPPVDFSRQQDLIAHMPLTKHADRYEICWVIDGSMHLQLNDRLIRLEKRQAVIIPPNVYHNELALRGVDGVVLWIIQSGMSLHISGVKGENHFEIFMGRNLQLEPIWCKLRSDEVLNELTETGAEPSDLLKCYMLQNLLVIAQELKKANKPMDAQQWRKSVVKDVVRHIQELQGQNVDLGELASYTGMSVYYLNQIFKDVTGETAMSFCNNSRITRAKELLRQTDLRVKEIAELLGYYDQYHFCKVFKKSTGISPTQYRNSH